MTPRGAKHCSLFPLCTWRPSPRPCICYSADCLRALHRRQAAGQVDFGALMNEMGPVLAQLMGGTGGNPALGTATNTTILPMPAAGGVQNVADRSQSAPPTSAAGTALRVVRHNIGYLPALTQCHGAAVIPTSVRHWLPADAAPPGGVDPAVEQVIRSQLPASEVDSWLQTLRRDAEDMRASERRPLSSSYRAGSEHPSSSSAL
jgi:hypothetical protein